MEATALPAERIPLEGRYDPKEELFNALSNPEHDYHSLAHALLGAFNQAAAGKGKERHADDLPFTEQKIQKMPEIQGHPGGLIYQISKKAFESEKMEPDARVRELQGVIVYAAGAIVFTENQGE